LVGILSRVAEGFGPFEATATGFPWGNAGANSHPVRPGEIRSCPARLFFSMIRKGRFFLPLPPVWIFPPKVLGPAQRNGLPANFGGAMQPIAVKAVAKDRRNRPKTENSLRGGVGGVATQRILPISNTFLIFGRLGNNGRWTHN
jgi:hypothetical protein